MGETDAVLYGPVKKGASFDFYQANLERKYGPGYQDAWTDTTQARMRAWGFNTVGNWSDERVWGKKKVPYVQYGTVGGAFNRIASGSDHWGKMPDPFDPRFAAAAAKSLKPGAAKTAKDPWCLGYFIDNELSWAGQGARGRYGLAYGALAQAAPGSPAKEAFREQLKAKYGEIGRLNAAWGVSLGSWEALDASFKPPAPPNAAMAADMSAFVLALARRYFTTVRDELKRQDPNHLYLGCRFGSRSREAEQAAGELCDVVSYNIYRQRIDPKEWSYLNSLNKPCLIGEFHSGAQDRGMFAPGLVSAGDQAGRAAMYRDYVRSVLEHPALVGCHWFEYIDQPLTGRPWDGENYNIGFVDITDTPYPELVAAARAVHREMYPLRSGMGAERAGQK